MASPPSRWTYLPSSPNSAPKDKSSISFRANRRNANISTDLPNSKAHAPLASILLPALGLHAKTINIAPAQVDRAALIAEFTVAEDAARPTRATKADTVVIEIVRFRPGVDGMVLSAAGAEVLNFCTDKTKKPRADIKDEILRAGYLHPVRSPSGAIVTGGMGRFSAGKATRKEDVL